MINPQIPGKKALDPHCKMNKDIQKTNKTGLFLFATQNNNAYSLVLTYKIIILTHYCFTGILTIFIMVLVELLGGEEVHEGFHQLINKSIN